MELQIEAQNMELSPAVRRYVERNMRRLNRHLPNIVIAKIGIVEEQTRSAQERYLVQVTLDSKSTLLRGEERGGDLFKAIDKVTEVMDRQIEHHKGKLYDKGRGSSLARGEFREEMDMTEPNRKVVKVKHFAVKPMAVAEAIEQMELLKHDFFLFLNAGTEEVNLVYRRRDGNYGLIEPEIG